MKIDRNPFVLGGRFATGRDFVNRRDELGRLKQLALDGGHLVVIGDRRVGKSNLLVEFGRQHAKALWFVYVDLLPATTREQLADLLADAISRPVRLPALVEDVKLSGSIEGPLDTKLSGEIALALRGRSASVEGVLLAADREAESRETRLVLVLDEFQVVRTLGGKVEAECRTAMQQLTGSTSMVFCGSSRGMMHDMFRSAGRPFYQAAPLLQIERMPAKDLIRHLKQRFKAGGYDLAPGVIETLVNEITGRRLIDTFRVASEAWREGRAERKIDRLLIERVRDEIVQSERYSYENLWSVLRRREHQVLRAIALGGGRELTSSKHPEAKSLPSASTIQQTLGRLVDERMILFREEGEYFYVDSFFERWVERISS